MNKEREPGWWFLAWPAGEDFGPYATFEEANALALKMIGDGHTCSSPQFVGPKLPEAA